MFPKYKQLVPTYFFVPFTYNPTTGLLVQYFVNQTINPNSDIHPSFILRVDYAPDGKLIGETGLQILDKSIKVV